MTRKTINVAFTSDDWRGVALSNFTLSPFELDGVPLASVEGFIQGIKFPPGHPAREQAFVSSAWEAKACGEGADKRFAYWDEASVEFGSDAHHRLVERALRARFDQNEGLRRVLQSTRGLDILHQTGEGPEPDRTSLPAALFCRILSDIREASASPQDLAERIVEQTTDALIYADRPGRIVRWNQAASRLFGFSRDEALGASLDLIIPEHLRAAHWAGYNAALASGRMKLDGRPTLTRGAKKDGGKCYVEMTFALVKNEQGDAIGSVAMARDVTARIEAERAARKAQGA
ncbi:PAS domain S-box protein [uncultured Castellaniella sp.]|uniref:PAS domain S-box protein n=1 Tax=uncultured Castellaniella sp. TaxID=647907 RepID=UPI00344A77BE